ncbi:MAG: hypothetical protein ACJZ79_02815 [Pseudohongiellaceae bacterium]
MQRIKVSFDTWIQLLGMIGVLGGLIFVGLEMRQSQRIAIADQQQGRAAIANDFITPFLENGLDFTTVFFNENPNQEFSQQDIAHRNIVQIHWFLFENDFYQYSQGLMDEPTWQAKLNGIKLIFDLCDVREIYKRREIAFSNEFKLVVQSLPDNCAE